MSPVLSLAFLLVVAYAGRTHTFGTYSTETDFYHYYAPDAARLAAGQISENVFQGPGYPAVLALLTVFTGDVFFSGKWLSLVSAALVGLFAFVLFARLFNYWVGVGAQLVTFASPEFAEFALCATTDMFFLMLCLACFVVFTTRRWPAKWRVALTAVLTGFAYLTRYNGLFLAASFLCGILLFDVLRVNWRERWRQAIVFVVIFFVVAAPWLFANYRRHGSPFYNANYLNIATEYYPELVDNTVQEGTRKLALMFNSFGDVLRYDTARLLRHYPENLRLSLQKSVTDGLVGGWVGWLALVGFVLALVLERRAEVWLLLCATVLYLLLLALTHWETRYYFFVMVVYAGLAVFAVAKLFQLARDNFQPLRRPAWLVVPVAVVLMMFADSAATAKKSTKKFLASQPYEALRVCEYFEKENVRGALVVARKPHVAALCEQEWVYFPTVKSPDDLREWLRQNAADYVVISTVEISRRRELAPLKDPRQAPPWLTAVWVNQTPTLALYRVERDRLTAP